MEDVSTGGAKVTVQHPVVFHRGQRLSILCLPEGDVSAGGQEAIRIEGQVAWEGDDHRCFGVRYG